MTGRYAAWRRQLAGGLSGTVLEIGAGDGANAGFLPPGCSWIALEPRRREVENLRRLVARHPGGGTVLVSTAEDVPLPDHSVDAVLATLVLCSVRDPEAVVAEARRVLRPQGCLALLEHVAAPAGSWTRRVERLYAPFSARFDRGCRPDRDTEATLRDAGFSRLDLEHFRLRGTPGLSGDHIVGTAVAG